MKTIILSLMLATSFAQANNVRIQNLRTSHNTTFLTFDRASLQDQPQSSETTVGRLFGYVDYSWTNDPWVDLDNAGENRVTASEASLVKTAQVLNLGVSYLLSKKLQLGIELPIEKITTKNHNGAGNAALDGGSTTGLGDIRLTANYNFYNNKVWAFSVIPTLYLPTGFYRVNGYASNAMQPVVCGADCEPLNVGASWGKISGGVKLAMDYSSEYFTLGLTAGIEHHPKAYMEGKKASGEVYKKVDFETTAPVGIGLFIPVKEKFGFNIEGTTVDIVKKHNEYVHPGEVLVGVRFWPKPYIATHLTYGTGSLEGLGGNDPRYIAGIKFPLLAPDSRASESQVAKVVPVEKPAEPQVKIVDNKLEVAQSVEFDLNSDQLTAKGKSILDEVATVLKNNSEQYKNIEIQGHTDHSGSYQWNLVLSIKRAESVKKYLVEQGLESSKLKTKGFGPTRPKYPVQGSTPAQIDLNRRVEFVLQK